MTETGDFYSADEIRQRLSISTYVFHFFRPVGEHALGELAEHGIRRIELIDSPEQFDVTNSRSMRLFADVCESCGIQIGSYHAWKTNFSDIETEEQRVARVDLCRRQLDTLLEMGGRVWGSHAQSADATMSKCYEELARHIEGTPATVAVENFVREGVAVEDRVKFIDELAHPQVRMILDIGHVRDETGANPMTQPGGPTRILSTIGDRLCHVHLHGFKGGVDHFPPLCDGDEIEWVELFRGLRSTGYAGDLNFEPSGEPRHTDSVRATGGFPERIVEMAVQAV